MHGKFDEGDISNNFQAGQRTSNGAVSPISPAEMMEESTDVWDFQVAVVFWKQGKFIAAETVLAV